MVQKTLVMYEVSQKQRYIFQTNRLIENMGASKIIREITEEPEELLRTFSGNSFSLYDEAKLDYKIVGGGNATYIFNDHQEAKQFARKLTSSVLRHIPGLELFLVMEKDVNWKNEESFLYDVKNENGEVVQQGLLSKMRDELANKKNRREHAVQQISWGVHQICSSSGLPATARRQVKGTQESRFVPCAKELVVKEETGYTARESDFKSRLIDPTSYNNSNIKDYQFLNEKHLANVFDIDNDNNAKSYVAVVHIDGNAMGVKVSEFLSYKFTSNDEYIKKYQQFTENIDLAYTNAFKKTIKHLMDSFEQWAEPLYDAKRLEEFKHVVPLRPIVASGDDICFITFGQLGIELGRIFLQYLQQESIKINGKKFMFEACAGVAIVKHKFPFWLAYELSEVLCSNAKKRLKADEEQWAKLGMANNGEQFDTSLIDWHIVRGGDLQLDLNEYRKTSYLNKDGSYLLQRPFYVQRKEDSKRHDANYEGHFTHAIKLITKSDENNADKEQARSKWKSLREVYHLGRHATSQWQSRYQFDLGVNQLFLPLTNGFKPYGAQESEYVSYFYDALDIVDYFIPLGEVN